MMSDKHRQCVIRKFRENEVSLLKDFLYEAIFIPQDEKAVNELSISADSDFIQRFSNLAAELQMAICITFLERHNPKPLNSAILFDRNGKQTLHYSKVHTCDFDLEKMLSPGQCQ